MLWDEVEKRWMDADGLVTPDPSFPGQTGASGNGLLYTGELAAVLYNRNELTGPIARELAMTLRRCFRAPGLPARAPAGHGFEHDEEGPDDFHGLLAYCAVARDKALAQDIIIWGKSHFYRFGPFKLPYYYDCVDPEGAAPVWSAWMGRFPQVIAMMWWAACETPWLPWRIYSGLVIIAAAFASSPDSRALTWLLFTVGAPHSWWVRITFRFCRFVLRRRGIDENRILSDTLHADHPLGKAFVIESKA